MLSLSLSLAPWVLIAAVVVVTCVCGALVTVTRTVISRARPEDLPAVLHGSAALASTLASCLPWYTHPRPAPALDNQDSERVPTAPAVVAVRVDQSTLQAPAPLLPLPQRGPDDAPTPPAP